MKVGACSRYYRREDLVVMEYFLVRLQRWDGDGGIELPETDEFRDDLTLLDELINFIRHPDQLPTTHQLMFQLVRLADYTGCDRFLQTAAAKLGTTVQVINNANPIGKVRQEIRNRYRMAQFLGKKQGGLAKCKLCQKPLMEPPALLSDSVTVQVCCSSRVHAKCFNFRNPSECPFCKISYTHFLNCCVCKGRIVCKNVHPEFVYMNWVHQKNFRTSCCGADVHQQCHENYFLKYSSCSICSVPLKNGQLQYDLCEGLDILHMRIWKRKIEERRNCGEYTYFTPLFSSQAERVCRVSRIMPRLHCALCIFTWE